jgi:hypothetical protein
MRIQVDAQHREQGKIGKIFILNFSVWKSSLFKIIPFLPFQPMSNIQKRRAAFGMTTLKHGKIISHSKKY